MTWEEFDRKREREEREWKERAGLEEETGNGRVPTGVAALDVLMEGGYERGKITEIYGMEGTGKSTLGLMAVRAVQRQGGTAVWVDAEGAFDGGHALVLGVDMNRLGVLRYSGEKNLEKMLVRFMEKGRVDLIVIDSVAALLPVKEEKMSVGQGSGYEHSDMLRRLFGRVREMMECEGWGTAVVLLNQMRYSEGYGKMVPAGGGSMEPYVSRWVELQRGALIGEPWAPEGQMVKARVLGRGDAEVALYYGKGCR